MSGKPVAGQAGHGLERVRLFEKMARPGADRQAAGARQQGPRLLVELEHGWVAVSHDQQRWGADVREPVIGEIGAAAAGDYGRYAGVWFGRCPERRGGAGTRPEVAESRVRQSRLP